ncbi:MAG TPA: acylglycerol kinase family protein, partial [Phototrophicaceae bacterium]|nr:acylglycerol kinase family protein [Phototrophicaceae bacterium]
MMGNQYQRIHVIINPAAGQDEPILNVLNRVFHEHGVDWKVSITHQAGDGTKLAREAVQAGIDLVAAYGGDGSVLEVANGLAGSNIPLAVLPGGTANAFASELGIPKNLEAAARLIFNSQERTIDLGRAGER